jgi:hypothetical protein
VSFLRGLFAARSHLAFLVGIAGAVLVVHVTSRVSRATARPRAAAAEVLPLRPSGPLTPGERELARLAWRFFEVETDPGTGLTRSVAGYPSTTMWEVGSQLMAVLAAEDLGLVSREAGRRLLARALHSLAVLPLCDGRLPNKAYHTGDLAMVDYDNRPAPDGIGWSALDVGRVLVPLSLLLRREPELTPLVERVVRRWKLEAVSDGVALRGATRRADGVLETYQEGRLGYEQYAARALLPWGVPAADALDYHAHAVQVEVSGEWLAADDRLPRDHGGTHNAVLSEPWLLQGLEQGLDAVALDEARAVLRVQERRWAATGRLTAVSEDALDRPPRFAYSAVLNGGRAWTAFAPDGSPAPLGFSTKAAVGWASLFGGPYTARLLAAAEELGAPGAGLYAGRYDATGEVNRAVALNTSAVVLEALAYRLHGPFVRAAPSGPPRPEARR